MSYYMNMRLLGDMRYYEIKRKKKINGKRNEIVCITTLNYHISGETKVFENKTEILYNDTVDQLKEIERKGCSAAW